MNRVITCLASLALIVVLSGASRTAVAKVGLGVAPPADAEVLFDGSKKMLDQNGRIGTDRDGKRRYQ